MNDVLTGRHHDPYRDLGDAPETRLPPTRNGQPSRYRGGIGLPLLIAALTLLCALPLWRCEYFPSQNGPSLLHIAFAQFNLNNPVYGFSEYFSWHPFPVPYLLQTAVLTLLFPVLDPVLAERVFITLLLLARPASVYYFLRGLGRGREIYTLACLPLLYDFSLMRGYFNYYAGISIGLLIFGYYLRHRQHWTTRTTLIFHTLVLLHYFTHPVALAVTGLLLAAYEFAASRSPARILEIVGRGYTLSLLLLVGFFAWSSMYGAWVEGRVDFLGLDDKIQNVFFRGATPLSASANAASLVLLAVVAGIGLAGIARRYGRFGLQRVSISPRAVTSEPMTLVVATSVALYMVMPWTFVGWHKADVRIIPVLFMMILGLPRALRTKRQRAVFGTACAAVVLVTLVPISDGLREGSRRVAEYVAGTDAVPRRSKMLTLAPAPDSSIEWGLDDAVDPIVRAGAYYAIRRGGATDSSLAVNNTLYFLWYNDFEDEFNSVHVDVSAPKTHEVAEASRIYDAVLLWDGPDRIRGLFERHGFRTTFRQGRMTVLVKERSSHFAKESEIDRRTMLGGIGVLSAPRMSPNDSTAPRVDSEGPER